LRAKAPGLGISRLTANAFHDTLGDWRPIDFPGNSGAFHDRISHSGQLGGARYDDRRVTVALHGLQHCTVPSLGPKGEARIAIEGARMASRELWG